MTAFLARTCPKTRREPDEEALYGHPQYRRTDDRPGRLHGLGSRGQRQRERQRRRRELRDSAGQLGERSWPGEEVDANAVDVFAWQQRAHAELAEPTRREAREQHA